MFQFPIRGSKAILHREDLERKKFQFPIRGSKYLHKPLFPCLNLSFSFPLGVVRLINNCRQ